LIGTGIGILALVAIVAVVLLSGCVKEKTNLPASFFPTQKESAPVYMDALLSDKPEELVVDDNGCLRAGGYLLIWPYGFSLTDIDGVITVVDNTGKPVVNVGDKIEVSGGECAGCTSEDIAKISTQLPNDRCSGPYWIVGNEIIRVPVSVEPTKEMVEKIIFYENGKQQVVNLKSEDGKGIAGLLTRKLHELNLQARCVFGEEDIQEIKQNDRVIELIFKIPTDITISQWVEPEERYHIPVDEKGYRILKSVKTALFILEDRQDRGLEAHILIAHTHVGDLPVVGYSCWAIKQEDSQELDKSWIKEINKMLKR